ncbi:MAG: hypothetical protein H0X34_12980 [Chthoniobacterales bacterium]|nr:hypothetical protein [Chthoniobacterales bacterium]
MKAVQEAILQKEAKEKARQRSVFEANFWRYIPKFGLPDEKEFFVPSYSTAAYRNLKCNCVDHPQFVNERLRG